MEFLVRAFHFTHLPLKDTKLLENLLLTFLSILALSAIALMHSTARDAPVLLFPHRAILPVSGETESGSAGEQSDKG